MILRVTFSIYLLLVLSCKCGFRSAVAQPVEAPSAEASPAASPTKKPSSRPSARARARIRAAERRAARAAKKEAEKQRIHEQWLARLIARGTTPWPEPTEQQHAAALARYRAMIAEVQKLSPDIRLYETEQFLFTSNIPPRQVEPYVRSLDKMYDWMCRTYGVPQGKQMWLGTKAPVFAFLTEAQFAMFELKYFQTQVQGVYGLCHQSTNGEVVIACFRGDNPDEFGHMLVHETSHGFIHRYKTKARLPSWVNEGMAELIGAKMVPSSKVLKNKERLAKAMLQQRQSLGRNFFSSDSIEGWQYGVASSMNRFLLEANEQNYVRFIEGLKEGMPWEESLQEAYGNTPQELVGYYGRWIGVPNLQP